MKNISGFTLSEVLITLSIIGVVAALTIPSLVLNNNEKQYIVGLKKAYNSFSNVFILARAEYGDPSTWQFGPQGTSEGSDLLLDHFAPYLKITRRCYGKEKGCAAQTFYTFGGSKIPPPAEDAPASSSSAILADGTFIAVYSYASRQNMGTGRMLYACGEIFSDVNGQKKPNAYGKDNFGFYITRDGILPMGNPDDITQYSLMNGCRSGKGLGCTAWALLNENMNYPKAGVGW